MNRFSRIWKSMKLVENCWLLKSGNVWILKQNWGNGLELCGRQKVGTLGFVNKMKNGWEFCGD